LERDVKIRGISREPLEANLWPATVKVIAEKSLFEIRIISETTKENFWIYDEKEALVSTYSVHDYEQRVPVYVQPLRP
jgi:hypothetical protein